MSGALGWTLAVVLALGVVFLVTDCASGHAKATGATCLGSVYHPAHYDTTTHFNHDAKGNITSCYTTTDYVAESFGCLAELCGSSREVSVSGALYPQLKPGVPVVIEYREGGMTGAIFLARVTMVNPPAEANQ